MAHAPNAPCAMGQDRVSSAERLIPSTRGRLDHRGSRLLPAATRFLGGVARRTQWG
jgi:hypothetical protein